MFFLKKAIESVLSQTFTDYEIIVVDDGSKDDTAILIDSYREYVDFISIPHHGVSRARNVGIERARHPWIAFLDSDDYWLPHKLEKQMEYVKNNPHYKICHSDEIWIKNGVRINPGKKHKKYEGWFFIPSLHICLISPSTVIVHRELFERVDKFDESMKYVEDYDLWLRITSRYPVGYVEEQLVVKQGGHDDQLSKQIDGIEKYRIYALEKLIREGNIRQDFLRQAKEVYKKKCEIYISGCRKRGRLDEIKGLQSRMSSLLIDLDEHGSNN